MTKIAQVNVDGIDFAVSGASLTGTCSSPASDFMKLVTLTDSNSIEDGVTIACTFVHENSAGTAPSSLTLYSIDQIHFYTDAGMTEPYVLAPSGCFELTYTGSGNAYSYVSYPVVAVGTLSGIVSAPVCDSHGKVTSRSLWKAGDVVFLQYKSRKFFVMNDGSGNSTAGVAFKGTRSAYNTAKLIPEGSDGHIPSGALVIITDEGKTYVTNGAGSEQTLELVANATFNGTQAEWNALTLVQKAMYNIVNFTDDEAIGLTVSDVVQDGNMNPVTSNAVYDYVNDVETVTGTTTIGGGTYTLKKIGKVVTLDVSGMTIPSTTGNVTVMTIPEKFRPSVPMTICGFFGGESISNGAMVGYEIQANGVVATYTYSAFSSAGNQLHASWIID